MQKRIFIVLVAILLILSAFGAKFILEERAKAELQRESDYFWENQETTSPPVKEMIK